MNPEEIEVLLNLPESARRKLAAIPGPGWIVFPATKRTDLHLKWVWPDNPEVIAGGWGWCPADTFAIVEACGTAPSLVPYRRPAFCASVKGSAGYGATPRLAALELLGAVCERDS
jgi:hypothetical protein